MCIFADTGLHLQGMFHLLDLWYPKFLLAHHFYLGCTIQLWTNFMFFRTLSLLNTFLTVFVFVLQVTFYEAFKNMTQYGKQRIFPNSDFQSNSTFEGLVLGGLAGGMYVF